MAFVRPVSRIMPKGNICMVFPYHVSFEGLEKNIICRDEEDCDILVKTLAVCARRKNVIIIIYAVVSNHAHVAVLAKIYEDADAFAKEVKRTYSMLFRKKYGEAKSLKDTTVYNNTSRALRDYKREKRFAFLLTNAMNMISS